MVLRILLQLLTDLHRPVGTTDKAAMLALLHRARSAHALFAKDGGGAPHGMLMAVHMLHRVLSSDGIKGDAPKEDDTGGVSGTQEIRNLLAGAMMMVESHCCDSGVGVKGWAGLMGVDVDEARRVRWDAVERFGFTGWIKVEEYGRWLGDLRDRFGG
ncbi:hypothetical protein HK101_001776 [Irineochytrium annulatum]|nr:hypothetical protein HK101_001776 [Irineochytrium annulatum]